jgi:HEPN domain-containing protein
MENNEEILEYTRLSETYLKAAVELLDEELFEPSLFNAIHALELAVKAALLTKIDNNLILHQVGGLFGREFRDSVGNDVCKQINNILSMYNLPRYPGTEEIKKEDAELTVEFVTDFISIILPKIIKDL